MFTHTRSRHSQICHFLRTKMVWSTRFQSGCIKLGVGPICCGTDFAPATANVWTHVIICVEANDPPASALRMCERTYLDVNTALLFSWCIDGLVQGGRDSIANALELHLSYTNPSISCVFCDFHEIFMLYLECCMQNHGISSYSEPN